ncbi:hypothetical protein GG344DRAFT_84345 [Lentinula edodes]|nr:hypothetical protein GG344DRAFT_84345 [Lentinula edodes]
MSASRTQTITTNSSLNARTSRSRPAPPLTTDPMELEEDDLEEDEDEIIQRAQEKVRRMKERKAAAAQQKAEEEAARKAVEEERAQAAAREERRKRMAEAATARSRHGSSLREGLRSPRRPVVEIRKEKGKGKARAPPVDKDPDDGGDGDDDDDEDERVKANTYHRHFNHKLDWLIMDATRRRRGGRRTGAEEGPVGEREGEGGVEQRTLDIGPLALLALL